MSNFNETMPEFWAEKAIIYIQKNDLNTARPAAEMAYKMEKNNIEYAFIYLLTLIDKSKHLSLMQLKRNLENADLVMKDLQQKRLNNILNPQQLEKYLEFVDEKYEFFQFVQDLEMRLDNY